VSIDSYRAFVEDKKVAIERLGHLIDCSMINPDLVPPRFVLDVLADAVRKPSAHRYSVSRGVKVFREAFADLYQNNWNVQLDAEKNICGVSGTKDAIFHFLAATCIQGDSILVTSPMYPVYEQVASVLGLRVISISIEELGTEGCNAIKNGTVRAVVLNSPHNPTGTVLDSEVLLRVIECASTVSVPVFNDFVYGEMVSNAQSLLSHGTIEGLLESYSLSKAYSVAGWRVGAVIGCEKLIQKISIRRSRLDYGTFLPLQLSSAKILTKKSIPEEHACRYRERARLLQRRFAGTGLSFVSQIAGLPFIWVKLPDGCSSWDVSRVLLQEHGIAIMPGRIFSSEHDAFARIALVVSEEELERVGSACVSVVRRLAASTSGDSHVSL